MVYFHRDQFLVVVATVLLCACSLVVSVNCIEFEDELKEAAAAAAASAEDESVPSNAKPRDFGLHSWNSGFFDFDDSFLWPFNSARPSFRNSERPAKRPTADEEATATVDERDPLGIEFISGAFGHPGEVDVITRPHQRPPTSDYPSQQPLFPGFGSGLGFGNIFPFNFGGNQAFKPWWKGDNVCVEREEDIEDWDGSSASFAGAGYGTFSLNFESCEDKPNKYVCTTVSNRAGKKRTVTVTRQCCHGYAPSRANGGYCEKVDMVSVEHTAEKYAKEFIRSAKNNGLSDKLQENITMFVPLDEAFTDFSEQMFESNLVVLPLARSRRAAPKDVSGITTKDLALNHIVKGFVYIEDIENEQLLHSEFENATIRMNIFPRGPHDRRSEYRYKYTANCVPLVQINKPATNGLVHVVSKVLVPVTQNLMEIIEARTDLTVLKTVLEKTDLAEMLSASNKTFTVFAPTDDAFMKLEPSIRRIIKEGNGCAMNILRNHILDLTFCSAAVVDNAKTNTFNVLGDRLNFERKNASSARLEEAGGADESLDLAQQTDVVINGQSRIMDADIMATNGVIHIVDTVMTTESGIPITALMAKRNLTTFKKLIDASGLADEFDMLSNASFFVPTDKALENSKWKRELDEGADKLAGNEELKKFIDYHVGLPYVKTCDLKEDVIKTRAGGDLKVNLYATHPLFANVMNRATVNCARLVHFDDESCGSVMHQLDKVLEPPTKDLLQLLDQPKYSKFLSLVKKANLTALLEDADQEYTVLVPSDEVFNEQTEWYETLLGNEAEVNKLVQTHILPDTLCCSGIVASEWPFVRSIESINKQSLKIDRSRRPLIANAGITKCDVLATNGVVHEINDVIIVKEKRTPAFF